MDDMAKTIKGISGKLNTFRIFSDFVEMAAISISNTVDLGQFAKREERYKEIVKNYKPDEISAFPNLMGMLILELEQNPSDVLGNLYHQLNLHNERTGQFFTPFPVCQMMAKVSVGGEMKNKVEEQGFVKVSEPACGSGAMVIALATELASIGTNFQQCMHVTAVDLDICCVHMAYLQLSLLHIPAVVTHGNSLSLEEYGHWYTPAHILGFWDSKLRRQHKKDSFTDTAKDTSQHIPQPLKQPEAFSKKQKKPGNTGQLNLFD